MRTPTNAETAWLAGIYEGEGSCAIRGSSPRLDITMTDEDVIRKYHDLIGIGNVRVRPIRGDYKQCYTWGVGGHDAVLVLQLLLPWLGQRRTQRANEAINAWSDLRTTTRKGDTHCLHGHELTPDNVYSPYKNGNSRGCRTCRKETTKRYREKRRAELTGS